MNNSKIFNKTSDSTCTLGKNKKIQKEEQEWDAELDHEKAPYLTLSAKAAALYHEATAIAPGSGTDARISPET